MLRKLSIDVRDELLLIVKPFTKLMFCKPFSEVSVVPFMTIIPFIFFKKDKPEISFTVAPEMLRLPLMLSQPGVCVLTKVFTAV